MPRVSDSHIRSGEESDRAQHQRIQLGASLLEANFPVLGIAQPGARSLSYQTSQPAEEVFTDDSPPELDYEADLNSPGLNQQLPAKGQRGS